jgi:SagB-type dehydrogenase family enzyme
VTPTPVHRYHDGTKHAFNSFARSLGYLDWASQPRPFRAYAGAERFPLYPMPAAAAGGYAPRAVTFDRLFDPRHVEPEPLSAGAIGDVLRHALGLSAWKRYQTSRWSLRVNPSSGNLHPTEAYVICEAVEGLADTPAVYHYAADRHALERRCAFDRAAWTRACGGPLRSLARGRRDDVLLIALTSIHWREAWKYGERAFRYCQHDLGHAMAAVGVAAAMVGWKTDVVPAWSQEAIATLTGIDRDEDFVDAEREEPGCLLQLVRLKADATTEDVRGVRLQPDLVTAVRSGHWSGRASQLSEDHVDWSFIDEIARETRDPGRPHQPLPAAPEIVADIPDRGLDARALVLQRRSALALDGRSTIDRARFVHMLSRVMPDRYAPWNVAWWSPRIHLALFVHRVDDVAPGLYLLPRDPRALDRLRAACGREFLWEPAHDQLPLMCLARGDARALAARLSCDQEIAADGFFSLGMLADVDASLAEHGPSFYRHLFWESGLVGQSLYLEAEAAGARSTGIGCFYDDPVHDVLGLQGHAFQSLYHFTVGMPVEDTRLTTEAGYDWE